MDKVNSMAAATESSLFVSPFSVAPFIGLLTFLWLESFLPLRKLTQSKSKRVIVNLALAFSGFVFTRVLFFPLLFQTSLYVTSQKIGLLPFLQLPRGLEILLGIVLMDWSLYYWHWMNHRFPFLWRFHNVHHVDLDMDVSTASRFHFGELSISTGYRFLQLLIFGIDPAMWILFETSVILSAQFHHSNIKLSFGLEKVINRLFVTPRMHEFHHSHVQSETNSNFSTIFSIWDRIHRTMTHLKENKPVVIIGVPSYPKVIETGFVGSMLLPFLKQRPWVLPNGSVPAQIVDKQ